MRSISDSARPHGAILHYAVALLIGAVIAGLFLAAVIPTINHFADSDSSRFVEAARNFLNGKGLLVSAHAARLPTPTEPLSLWPPGYPIMIALGSKILGADPLWIAPRISWACWILMPVAILFALRPVLRNSTIHAISAMAMLAPGTVYTAHRALSDLPFLLLTTLSLALLFRGTLTRLDWRLIVLSGLVGGAAYTTRNVGLALFGTIVASAVIFGVFRPGRAGDILKVVSWWFAGAVAVLIPLELRNLLTFDDLQPYSMAPSTVGLAANVRYYLIALFDAFAGQPGIGHGIFWDNKVLIAAIAAVSAGLFLSRKFLARRWTELSLSGRQVFIILLCNIILGSAIVILARTRYQWGELINPRYLQQYDWMMFALIALLIEPLLRKSKAVLAIASAILIALLGLRAGFAIKITDESRNIHRVAVSDFDISRLSARPPIDDNAVMQVLVSRDGDLMRAIKDLPPDTLLLSNRHEVLRNETGRPVTKLVISEDCTIQSDVTASLKDTKAALFFFPTRTLVQSGCWPRLTELSQSRAMLHLERPYLASLTQAQAGKFRPRHAPPWTRRQARPDIDE